MAYILKIDGTTIENCSMKIPDIQAVIGGYFQIVNAKDGQIIIINENGKLESLPINQKATELYQYGKYDPIVGDVIICNQSELNNKE